MEKIHFSKIFYQTFDIRFCSAFEYLPSCVAETHFITLRWWEKCNKKI